MGLLAAAMAIRARQGTSTVQACTFVRVPVVGLAGLRFDSMRSHATQNRVGDCIRLPHAHDISQPKRLMLATRR